MVDAPRILIVDDGRAIAATLDELFRTEGYRALVAYDGPSGSELPEGGAGLALLDVSVPGMDGLEICRRLRDRLGCPVVLLTVRVCEGDQPGRPAVGEDDCVAELFSPELLGSRVRAQLARRRRDPDASGDVRLTGGLAVDCEARTVEVVSTGTRVDLTRIEFDILALLTESPGRVFDRNLIYQRVWGRNAIGDPSVEREHVRRVRAKLSAAGADGGCLETVWGVGYRWAGR